ncbi:hypothetical protein F4804DRAFT_338045 [Jackrogersella minutella]|nr:hypothetical protein F4804DRAFT_338045 [Jackrogersella minutella]
MKALLFRVVFLTAAVLVDAQSTTSTTASTTSTPAATSTSTFTSTSTSTSTSTTGCAAQNILDTCLDTTESYVPLCETTDYDCLCDKYVAVMTCFNNCPNDPRQPSYQQQKDQYCTNASLYSTASTTNQTVTRVATSTSNSITLTKTEVVMKSASAASASAGAAESQNGNSAQGSLNYAGGMLAGLAGLVAVFL